MLVHHMQYVNSNLHVTAQHNYQGGNSDTIQLHTWLTMEIYK